MVNKKDTIIAELTRDNKYLRGKVDNYVKIIENQVVTTDKVVLTKKEANDLLYSFYDLIFAVDNCEKFEDLKQWVHIDLSILQPICIDTVEQVIGNVDSSPIKFSGKYGDYMELVNRVTKNGVNENPTFEGEITKMHEAEEVPCTYVTELEALTDSDKQV